MIWEFPDIADMLKRRDEETDSGGVGPYTVPLGQPAMGAEIPQGHYVIDPDYAELLGIDFDDLIKDK